MRSVQPEDFYKDRPFIQNEYEEGPWDEASGLPPEEIGKLLREYAETHREDPYPVVTAHEYRILLENAQLGINPHQLFPDKLRHGASYVKDATNSVLELLRKEEYNRVFEEKCPAAWHQRLLLKYCGIAVPDADVWHTVPDFGEVFRLGLPGLLDRVIAEKVKKLEAGTLTEAQEIFYEAEEIAFRALNTYVERLKDAAGAAGLRRYQEALQHLLAAPPESLYEVLCLTHIVMNVEELGIERCRSLGPIDVLYTPYYVRDLERGRETKDSVREMFRYFFQKLAAEKRYADQPVCIGEAWESDDCPAAELITLMLEAYRELDIHNPKLHVRIRKDYSVKFLRMLASMIRAGNSSMVLLNDRAVLAAYRRIGLPEELTSHYIPIGCYEMTVMGEEDARICASWINLAKACEYTISGGYDFQAHLYPGLRTEEPKDFEAFMETYYRHLRSEIDAVIKVVDEMARFTYAANPSPYYSGTVRSCVERGRDVFDGGMNYRNQSLKCFAIASAVDAILAVKKYVYEEKRLTLAEFSDILSKNWKGKEALRSEILRDPVKYGNHLPEADRLAREIFDFCGREIIGRPTSTGGVYRLGCDSVNMAEEYGRFTGAGADGRLAGTPLSKNLRPVNGCEKRGVTAFLQSVLALDNTLFVDGAPLDFILHPSQVEGEDGLSAMVAMLRLFMEGGGLCIHGNVLALDTLKDAMKHPENYPTLQVRVCGWNEYFVNMSPETQADFIARLEGTEHAAS